MMKFLRKHKAIIMAFGGSLLMIAFLMPNALDMLGRMGVGRTIATYQVKGEILKVKWSDYEDARKQTQFLRTAFERLYPGLVPIPIEALIPATSNDEDDPQGQPKSGFKGASHWILLKEEAKQAGFLGGRGEGEQVFQNWVASQLLRYDNDFNKAYANARAEFVGVAGSEGLTEVQAYEALSDYLAVLRMFSLYGTLGVMGEQRLQYMASEFESSFAVQLLFLDSGNFIDTFEDPAEAELLDHFETYRGAEPGTGEYSLGYRQPDRIKFEFIRVDFQSIVDAMEVTGLEARNWYVRNGARVTAQKGMPEPPEFDLIRDNVIDQFRYEKAEEKARSVIDYIKGELLASRQGIERDGDYRVLPEDWADQCPSFDAIRSEVSSKFGVDAEYIVYTDRWSTMNDLRTISKIGRAGRSVGSQRAYFADMVTSIREFGQAGAFSGLQVGLADASPLRGDDNGPGIGGVNRHLSDIFFFRVVEADAARPAASLDEVRDDVVRDVKRLAAYRSLIENKDIWLTTAIENDLDGLIDQAGDRPARLTAKHYDTYTMIRGDGFAPPTMGRAGESQELIDAIFAKAEAFQPLDKIDTFDLADRFVVVSVPRKLGLAVVRIDRQTPLTREVFRNRAMYGVRINRSGRGVSLAQVEAMLIMEEDHTANAFGWEALTKRFVYISENGSEDDETSEPGGMGGSSDGDEAPGEEDAEG